MIDLYKLATEGRHFQHIYKVEKEFKKELEQLINKYSLEQDSNTPDFILANYLFESLICWNIGVAMRCVWYNPENK